MNTFNFGNFNRRGLQGLGKGSRSSDCPSSLFINVFFLILVKLQCSLLHIKVNTIKMSGSINIVWESSRSSIVSNGSVCIDLKRVYSSVLVMHTIEDSCKDR